MADPLLDAAGLTFRYSASSAAALDGITLRLAPGESMAVLGPLGSGTSTLCRAAAGMLVDHGQFSGELQASPAGLLGDDPEAQLTGMGSTVWDEVLLPARLTGLSLEAAAHQALALLDQLGLTELTHRPVFELSGGQRQLTALASLLVMGRKLLILDQPGLSLDATARSTLRRVLAQHCAEGGAVLVAGHQHDELSRFCQRTAFLDQGRLSGVQDGQPSREQLSLHGVWDTADDAPGAERADSETSSPHPGDTLLQVQGLSLRRGGKTVLDGVGLDLRAGEITAVLGPNGAGKSSLLLGLAGLLPKESSGRIIGPAGVELSTAGAHRRAGYLAWVGQDPGDQLSASTVEAELRYATPKRASRQDIADLLDRVGLADHSETHPYDLSAAQRKDLVLATALLLHPRVLLLDEPTLGRDKPAMDRISAVLRGFADDGGAVLVTTHDHRWAAQISQQILRVPAQ